MQKLLLVRHANRKHLDRARDEKHLPLRKTPVACSLFCILHFLMPLRCIATPQAEAFLCSSAAVDAELDCK